MAQDWNSHIVVFFSLQPQSWCQIDSSPSNWMVLYVHGAQSSLCSPSSGQMLRIWWILMWVAASFIIWYQSLCNWNRLGLHKPCYNPTHALMEYEALRSQPCAEEERNEEEEEVGECFSLLPRWQPSGYQPALLPKDSPYPHTPSFPATKMMMDWSYPAETTS